MSFEVVFDSRYPGLLRDKTWVKLSAFFTCLSVSVALFLFAVYLVSWWRGRVTTQLDKPLGYFLYSVSVILFLSSPVVALCKGYNRGLTGTLLFRFVREDDTGRWTYRLESTKKGETFTETGEVQMVDRKCRHRVPLAILHTSHAREYVIPVGRMDRETEERFSLMERETRELRIRETAARAGKKNGK